MYKRQAIGSLVGTVLDIDGRFKRLTGKFSKSNLGEGLATAILLFCIGTLSILGPIESALNNNHTPVSYTHLSVFCRKRKGNLPVSPLLFPLGISFKRC